MVTPSAPTLGSVKFGYIYPNYRMPETNFLETDAEKHELCDATDEIFAGFGFLREIQMDFCYGSVTLTGESQDDPEVEGTTVLDVVATKFFRDNDAYIANINPNLALRIHNNELTKDIRKISDIFYRTYQRYLQSQTNAQGELDNLVDASTIEWVKPGFKNFHRYVHYENKQVTSLDTLEKPPGNKFKKCIQMIPPSLLSRKGKKKVVPFLQAGLDQKNSYADKLLYLKQVLFLLTFQDVFKDFLQTTQQSLGMDQNMLYTSPSREYDISNQIQHMRLRVQQIETTLSQLPVNDVAMLIPLACRSSLAELSEDGDFFENGNTIEKEYLLRECGNARRADMAIREVLENSFQIIPKNFSTSTTSCDEVEGMNSIESYLMGISGLAISPGLMGRLPMRDHHTVYYKRSPMFSIPHVSDNLPVEFLMTAAQFYSGTNDDWIEEKCLGYVTEMMGQIRPQELEALKATIGRVRKAVHNAPVDSLLKPRPGTSRCSSQQYVLRNSSIEKLQDLYKQTRARAGLAPLPASTSSSCSVM